MTINAVPVWKVTNIISTMEVLRSPKSTVKVARKWTPKFLISQTTVILNESQGHPNWHQNVELCDLYDHTKFQRNRSVNVRIQASVTFFHHYTKFEPNWFINVRVHANNFFLTLSVSQQLFPLFHSRSLIISVRMFIFNCFNLRSNFILISWKVPKKIKPRDFALRWPCDHRARSRSVKVVWIGQCAYKHGWYKKWLKSLLVMSNVNVLLCRTAGRRAIT